MKIWKKLMSKRLISPLIATLILVGVAITGGLMVYGLFSSTAETLGARGLVTVESANLVKQTDGTVAFSITVKNTGTKPVTGITVIPNGENEIYRPITFREFFDYPDGILFDVSELWEGKYESSGNKYWKIEDKELSGDDLTEPFPGSGSGPIFVANLDVADFTLEFKMNVKEHRAAWNVPWIFFRYSPDSCYFVLLKADGILELSKSVNNVKTVLKTASCTYEENVWKSFKIECRGREIKVSIDGVLYINVYDDAVTHGTIGFHPYYCHAHFDDVIVTSFLQPGQSTSLMLTSPSDLTQTYVIGNAYTVVVKATFSDGSTYVTTTSVTCRTA